MEAKATSKKSPVLVMVIMLVSMTAGAICMNKTGPVLTELVSDLGITTAQSGLLVSIFTLSGIFLSIPMGLLTTKYGTFKTGLFSLLCLIIGSALGAMATGFGVMLFSRFLEGIGLMFLVCIGPAAVGKTSSDANRGTLMGIVMCFMSFGQAIALNIAPIVGWRAFWWISAGFSLVGLLLWVVFIRGIDDGDDASASAESVSLTKVLSEVLKNESVWMVSLTFLAFMLAHMGVFNYFPTYLTEVLGMSNTTAGTLTSLEALIGIPAGILGGRLADKWASPKKALALTLALMTVLIFCLPVFNAGNFIVALCIYGVVANSEAGLCMTSVSEVVPPEQANTAIAVVNTAQWTGAFLGPLLFATILSSTGWATCFHTMAAICVVAMVAILLAKRLR